MMGRPLNLVILLAVLAGGFAFVGTLLSAPSPFDARQYGAEVRAAAAGGDWEAVGRLSRRACRRDPRSQEAMMFWGMSEDRLGHQRGAEAAWTRLRDATRARLDRGTPQSDQWYYLGWAMHGLGDDGGAARAWREHARRIAQNGTRYNAACYLTLAGEIDAALTAWEAVDVRERGFSLGWARVDPDLDSIRNHPRFEAGMQRLELEQQRLEREAAAATPI